MTDIILASCERCEEKWLVCSDIGAELQEGTCFDCQAEGDVERPLTFKLWAHFDLPMLPKGWLAEEHEQQ